MCGEEEQIEDSSTFKSKQTGGRASEILYRPNGPGERASDILHRPIGPGGRASDVLCEKPGGAPGLRSRPGPVGGLVCGFQRKILTLRIKN